MWWQILLMLISWVIVWSIGAAQGYSAGWNARERADRDIA